jgi:hypothetical protein
LPPGKAHDRRSHKTRPAPGYPHRSPIRDCGGPSHTKHAHRHERARAELGHGRRSGRCALPLGQPPCLSEPKHGLVDWKCGRPTSDEAPRSDRSSAREGHGARGRLSPCAPPQTNGPITRCAGSLGTCRRWGLSPFPLGFDHACPADYGAPSSRSHVDWVGKASQPCLYRGLFLASGGGDRRQRAQRPTSLSSWLPFERGRAAGH